LRSGGLREARDGLTGSAVAIGADYWLPSDHFGYAAWYFVLSQTNRRMLKGRLAMPISTLARAMPIARTMRPIGPL
jgi:hypothetical protein